MRIDRVHFYVEDAKKWGDWFARFMGFQSVASGEDGQTRTQVLTMGGEGSSSSHPLRFVFSSPVADASPVAEFLKFHPPGVADVAFEVNCLPSTLDKVAAAGGIVRQPLQIWQSSQGRLKWSQIVGISGLHHTLTERRGKTPILPHSWMVERQPVPKKEANFIAIDHLVLNVAAGELEKTACWYERVFDWQRRQAFTIQTPRSGLYSQVLVHPSSGLQFAINEPTSVNSQIQEFLDINRGSGIQHIALKTEGILKIIWQLRKAGLEFLTVPQEYYNKLQNRFVPWYFSAEEWEVIVREQVLLDWEQRKTAINSDISPGNPLILQIFSQPIFTRPTFFFEFIERRDRARGFGEGNFQALFEAMEREQLRRTAREWEISQDN